MVSPVGNLISVLATFFLSHYCQYIALIDTNLHGNIFNIPSLYQWVNISPSPTLGEEFLRSFIKGGDTWWHSPVRLYPRLYLSFTFFKTIDNGIKASTKDKGEKEFLFLCRQIQDNDSKRIILPGRHVGLHKANDIFGYSEHPWELQYPRMRNHIISFLKINPGHTHGGSLLLAVLEDIFINGMLVFSAQIYFWHHFWWSDNRLFLKRCSWVFSEIMSINSFDKRFRHAMEC